MSAIEKVLALAEEWVGYLEKSASAYKINPTIVYDKKLGAGKDNYTMVWQDIRPSFQGQAWCQGFIYWLFFKAFGADMAQKMLYLDDWNSYEPWTNFACYSWAKNFENHGVRYQSSKAKVGDIIYFTKSHTGIVYKIADGYVYTIEGNTSNQSEVVSNGGGVFKKSYKLGIDAIYCYGRPNYAIAETTASATSSASSGTINMPTLEKGVTAKGTKAIYVFQVLTEHLGYYALDIDGSYGGGSKTACERLQRDHGLPVTGICDARTWRELLTNTTY